MEPTHKIVKSAAERGDRHTGWQSGDASPRLNTRIRKVFPTSEIPHKWAHQTQAEARNPQGNLFFDGPTIFSYRISYPIAHIYTRRGGAKLVLVQENRYSATTAQHIYSVKRAIPDEWVAIDVPYVLPASAETHAANITFLTDNAAASLKRAQHALSRTRVKEYQRDASCSLANCGRYMSFFSIRRKAPHIPVAEWLAAQERAKRIENPDPKAKNASERAAAKRKERAKESGWQYRR